jgi:DNA-binding XRE family transcriptional regulator
MDKVALPFMHVPKTVPILPKIIVLDEYSSIGLHIRKHRIESGLLQREVADMIGVSEDSITNWENGRMEPQIQFGPKIIKFLGYVPIKEEKETLGGRIKYYRFIYGLSHDKLGKLLIVDASTIRSWENGKFNPSENFSKKIELLLRS